jgi:hypothetical protein
VIERLVNRALAGLTSLLVVAVGTIVVVIAVVAFRSIVEEPAAAPAVATTVPATVPPPTTPPPPVPTTTSGPAFDCAPGGGPRPDERARVVRLFFACGPGEAPSTQTWVYREIDAEGDPVVLTMIELIRGPDAEERLRGYRSLFSTGTAGALIEASNVAGEVTVDLRDLGPQPALATGEGAEFLVSLTATVFQHEGVTAVDYLVEGSCERFWAYFDESACRTIERTEWERDPVGAVSP